ncbi:aldehyde dehydrogenase family protein, partial [Escherichia coli]|uniref:aldehyde dehydrogenase family protein n=1 Tax=Escherichia coli TaxID=562 RepID=UPI0011CAA1ED
MNTQLTIGSEQRDARGGATLDRRKPLTDQGVSTGAAGTVDDAIDAVEAAAAAFPEWSTTGPTQRRAVMLKAADLIEERGGEFIEAMMSEVGAAQAWAGFNVFL